MDEFWSNLDYTIFDSEKPPKTNTLRHKEQVNNKIKVETDSTSVVIDLVADNNNSKHLKSSVNSGNERRTKPLPWSENIVIKTEQKAINDFDNCLENINNRDTYSLSATSGNEKPSASSSTSPSIRTNNSQGINITNQFRHPGAVSDRHQCSLDAVPAPFGDHLNNAGLSSNNNYVSNNRRSLDMDITDGISVFQHNNSVCEDADSQLYAELFGDWLHFRPKTPEEDFDNQLINDFGENMPQFAENTSLSVEIQRLCAPIQNAIDAPITSGVSENIYQANPFSFDELVDDRGVGVTSSQDCSSSNENLNLSGDSLPELSLSLGENEENEKNFVNFLEDCAELVDLKDLPNPNFWNGLLDDSGGPLDIIDDRKPSAVEKIGYTSEFVMNSGNSPIDEKGKGLKKRVPPRLLRNGHSSFNVTNFNATEEVFKRTDETQLPVIDRNTPLSVNSATVAASQTPAPSTSGSRGTAVAAASITDAKSSTIKKEFDSVVAAADVISKTNIKTEQMDEVTLGFTDDIQIANRSHNLPVIKTEIVNNMPVIAGAVIQRPLTLQQNVQLQSSQTTDSTLLISTPPRQARRFATNGPTDNKLGTY